jgi:phosphonate transport system substrate-binding protein
MVQESAYTHFERGIKDAKYDLFNAGPMLCSESLKNYEPVALIEREGSRSYTGITFVPRTSNVKSVSDLKGKTIGMVSATSTSGGLYPQKLLLDAGLRPGKDVRIKWFGSHAKVAHAVKKGWVHAGACFEDCRNLAWKTQQQKTKATRILAYTADIPAEMIMIKRNLPDATKAAIRAALTNNDDREGILARISQQEPPISAIVAATEQDLKSVQKVIQQVRAKNKKK